MLVTGGRLHERQQLDDGRLRFQDADKFRIRQKHLIVFTRAILGDDQLRNGADFFEPHIPRGLGKLLHNVRLEALEMLPALATNGDEIHRHALRLKKTLGFADNASIKCAAEAAVGSHQHKRNPLDRAVGHQRMPRRAAT